MADVTVKRLDECETVFGGAMARVRSELGVTSFGMQVINLPPSWDGYPEHDHAGDGQEEVYVPISGSVTLVAAGKEHVLTPGSFARVGPGEKRTLKPGAQGAQLLCLGGTPGKAFEVQSWTEVGQPEPAMP